MGFLSGYSEAKLGPKGLYEVSWNFEVWVRLKQDESGGNKKTG